MGGKGNGGSGRKDPQGREKKKEPGERYLSPGKRYALEEKRDKRDMNRPEPPKFRLKPRWEKEEEKEGDKKPTEYWTGVVVKKSGTDFER